MKVRLENVRLGFAHQLFTPSALEENQVPKFGCDSLLVPGSVVKKFVPDAANPNTGKWVVTTMPDVLAEVANDAMKGKGKVWLESLENSKKCYRNGDLRVSKSGDVYEGYEGNFYVTAKNKARPLLIDRDKSPLTEADGKPYSGCYANVTIDVYAMTDPKKKGVHASIKGVQFVKDGDAFGGGGGTAKPDDFDDLGVEEEEESLAG